MSVLHSLQQGHLSKSSQWLFALAIVISAPSLTSLSGLISQLALIRGCGSAKVKDSHPLRVAAVLPWHSAGRSGSWRACSRASGTARCGCLPGIAPPPGGPGCDAGTASPPWAAAARASQSWAPWSSRSRRPPSTARRPGWAPRGPSRPPCSSGWSAGWAAWPRRPCGTPSGRGGGCTRPRCRRGWSRMPGGGAGGRGSPECSWVWCSGCPRSRTGEPGRCCWRRTGRNVSGTLVPVSPHSFRRQKKKNSGS